MRKRIVLCGSTKFKDEYLEVAKQLGEEAFLVVSVTTFTHADGIETSKETAAILDAVHLQKIYEADAIYVINKDGYIGYSTLREIAWAAVLKRRIVFHEEPSTDIINMLERLNASVSFLWMVKRG